MAAQNRPEHNETAQHTIYPLILEFKYHKGVGMDNFIDSTLTEPHSVSNVCALQFFRSFLIFVHILAISSRRSKEIEFC